MGMFSSCGAQLLLSGHQNDDPVGVGTCTKILEGQCRALDHHQVKNFCCRCPAGTYCSDFLDFCLFFEFVANH